MHNNNNGGQKENKGLNICMFRAESDMSVNVLTAVLASQQFWKGHFAAALLLKSQLWMDSVRQHEGCLLQLCPFLVSDQMPFFSFASLKKEFFDFSS